MTLSQFAVCYLTVVLSVSFTAEGNDLARGFNDDITWVDFENGHKLAKEQNKMIFMLIHKSWCQACKALKPQFATSMEIEKLAPEFVMVNIMDDEEPKDRKYQPDGGYIPRILFLSPDGEVKVDLPNPNANPSYKFYYPKPDDIVAAMKKALSFHSGQTDEL